MVRKNCPWEKTSGAFLASQCVHGLSQACSHPARCRLGCKTAFAACHATTPRPQLACWKGNPGPVTSLQMARKPLVTGDLGFEPSVVSSQGIANTALASDSPGQCANSVSASCQVGGSDGAGAPPMDPELATIARAWPGLPEPIRRAMLALVSS